MLWIGSNVEVVPIGAPQLSQKDANERDPFQTRRADDLIALVSELTRHLNRLQALVVDCGSNLRLRPAQESTCRLRSVYSGWSPGSDFQRNEERK
jgi:hypothetical protein